MKPIHFKTEMVQAILDNRKSQTRRPMVPQPMKNCNHTGVILDSLGYPASEKYSWAEFHHEGTHPDNLIYLKAPYKTGDVLYVRETWTTERGHFGHNVMYADGSRSKMPSEERQIWIEIEDNKKPGYCSYLKKVQNWRPSIHMPEWAARLFLNVTGERVERVQDITGRDVLSEGVDDGYTNPKMGVRFENGQRMAFQKVWNSIYATPQPIKENGEVVGYRCYPWSVEDFVIIMGGGSVSLTEYKGLPLKVYDNPWVWVTEFEKSDKPEGSE